MDYRGCSRIRKKDSEAKFVFVGDYCDRGKNSAMVVEFLVDWTTRDPEGKELVCLRGNHDDVILVEKRKPQGLPCG